MGSLSEDWVESEFHDSCAASAGYVNNNGSESGSTNNNNNSNSSNSAPTKATKEEEPKTKTKRKSSSSAFSSLMSEKNFPMRVVWPTVDFVVLFEIPFFCVCVLCAVLLWMLYVFCCRYYHYCYGYCMWCFVFLLIFINYPDCFLSCTEKLDWRLSSRWQSLFSRQKQQGLFREKITVSSLQSTTGKRTSTSPYQMLYGMCHHTFPALLCFVISLFSVLLSL